MTAEQPSFDRAGLESRMCGDDELIRDVIRLFLEDCPIRVAAIRAAIAARDDEGLRTTAHALKGAASYMSAHAVVALASELEAIGRDQQVAEAGKPYERLEQEVGRLMTDLQRAAAQAPPL